MKEGYNAQTPQGGGREPNGSYGQTPQGGMAPGADARFTNIEQKVIHPLPGIPMLILMILVLLACVGGYFIGSIAMAGNMQTVGILLWALSAVIVITDFICFTGFKTVGPNEAMVLTLFGKYYGTILQAGFFLVNPFAQFANPTYRSPLENEGEEGISAGIKAVMHKAVATSGSTVLSGNKKTVSLKKITLNNGAQKVNDVMGNPVIIGAVVIWRVDNPTKAVFNVENYIEFLSIQTDSTIRNVARLYPYDVIEDDELPRAGQGEASGRADQNEKTLRGSSQEIALSMQRELGERVAFAGLVIEEVRITHLAYAEEIAAAMLQRQQASAIIAARTKIVEGAVGMVKMALEDLNKEDLMLLDDERKAQMVSNLLVVLCSGRDAQPVVNSGSMY